ncbi:unnamed protein product [Rotaria sp. Silwood2]|nr:unnamed protein product [Rotaria sp. Silwood2]CAF3894482.1 unnamed protein product [Rotaria sp. Silwood2]CAF4088790.1 unnamed protein product [Rotaria sp. Silwood2]CAF4156681.1 unnamed protein product [Rotaria sp. Silwood2]
MIGRNKSSTTLLDSNNNKCVNNNFTNAQDILAVALLTRITTIDGSSSSSVPMITIHIIPEVAQALLASTPVDKAKFAELLHQVNVNNSSSTTTISDSRSTNTSTNITDIEQENFFNLINQFVINVPSVFVTDGDTQHTIDNTRTQEILIV